MTTDLKAIPTKFRTDPKRFTQIVNNLISNALKYTEKNGQVEVLLVAVDEGLKFLIKDTGIGIKNEDQKNIFKLFYNTDEAMQINKSSNHGIGLYISKKLSIKLSSAFLNQTLGS